MAEQNPDLLNATLRAMTTMAESMSLSNMALQLPTFDGSTSELQDFIQDVKAVHLRFQPNQEPS